MSVESSRETMNVVIVGHVDHGKSTLVGRLLADTGTLGDGKLEKVQAICRRQGKQFEYAFLLDALEEEQGQGITIDAARVFFKSERRDYIIIDAPGHIEFLKNMVTGAARAEAAVLLIDAKEGVQDNSRRHGYLLSMLGIRQVVVAVNKIDLVDCRRDAFEAIVAEYRTFLKEVGIEAKHFIPMSARDGDLVTRRTERLAWYDGPTILEALDGFTRRRPDQGLPLRLPVQDVYKWNERGDDRRIIAGRIEAGSIKVGDRVVFSPSNKTATVASIERWAAPASDSVAAGRSTGVTMTEQIFVGRGELMSHLDTMPQVSTRLRVNLFWLGKRSMEPGRRYKLKLATAETEVSIDTFHRVLDASSLLVSSDKRRVDRHDVADLVLRTRNPVAFDSGHELEATSRFVIVDGYDIAGGGIVREAVADAQDQDRLESRIRDLAWVRGDVTAEQRAERQGHPASLVMFTGELGTGKHLIARALEVALFGGGHRAYLLDGRNLILGVDADVALDDLHEVVRRFGEVAHILLDAGNLVVSTTNVIGLGDHDAVAARISPYPVVLVHLGPESPEAEGADLRFQPNTDPALAVPLILDRLRARGLLRS
jgi:bifunctional enzyme CysN/CysC